jgi:hypothetical protein
VPSALTASDVLAFIVIPVCLAFALVWGVARTSGRTAAVVVGVATIAWMTLVWRIAASGALRNWENRPPPFALLVVAIVLLASVIAFSGTGRRIATGIPLWTLVAVQGFRLPLELAMHGLTERGIMPAQMTYTGANFDILTGTTALIVAIVVATGRAGWRTVLVWNVAGTLLLVNVVVIAILSTPAIAYFGGDRLNVFVTYTPFVWLPAAMVLAAMAGHLLIYRAVILRARGH